MYVFCKEVLCADPLEQSLVKGVFKKEAVMTSYRIFTIAHSKVEAGAAVQQLCIKGAGIEIPAILMGEEGRGRSRGVIPVGNLPLVPCPDRGKHLCWPQVDQRGSGDNRCFKCQAAVVRGQPEPATFCIHPDAGDVAAQRILFASIGATKAGKPKFLSATQADTDEFMLAVLRTPIGYRGSNQHTGDRTGEVKKDILDREVIQFHPFPGEIIAEGHIAQGDAGRAGSGMQLVAKIPKNTVFRTGYSGRLYGGPSSHYFKWDGFRVISATWEERAASDAF